MRTLSPYADLERMKLGAMRAIQPRMGKSIVLVERIG